MALTHHPDRPIVHGVHMNKIDQAGRFNEIHDAYELLILYVESTESTDATDATDATDSCQQTSMYSNLLGSFIVSIVGNWTSVEDVVDRIFVSGYIDSIALDDASINILLSALTVNQSLVASVLGISSETVVELRNKIVSTIDRNRPNRDKDIKSYTINPTITDCFNSMIVEVVFDGITYYVPSWHYNVSFDTPCGRLDVLVEKPTYQNIGSDFDIDENNNILATHINRTSDIITNRSRSISVLIGKQTFQILVANINIQRKQVHIFKGMGIPRIVENDIYNFNDKSDVIISLILDDVVV